MKKNLKRLSPFLIILLLILVCFLYFGNLAEEYYFTVSINNEENNIKVNIFLTKNKNGSLLVYNTNIYYTEENIVGGGLFYYEDNEKNIILGNELNSYDYDKNNQYKKEYGYSYFDNILKNTLYFDLCLDTSCNSIFKTIKLESYPLQ